MAYSIETNEPLGDGVRRCADDQLTKARRALQVRGVRDAELRARVHDVRKRAKKVRGLVRLVRPELGKRYQQVNAPVRDAARLLSPVRDDHALLATFDAVVAARPDALAGLGAAVGVRQALQERAVVASREALAGGDVFAEAEALLAAVHHGVADWEVGEGFDAAAGGLHKTYGRGRKALDAAAADGTDEQLHELRKRAKYTWYHLRLLRPGAPLVIGPMARSFGALSDALGDDHDLAVLSGRLRDGLDGQGGEGAGGEVLAVLAEVRSELQARALGLAHQLYAEEAEAFVERLRRYRAAGERGTVTAEPVGEITTLWPPEQADDGLDDLSRADLYERARAAGVPRRSLMARDELVAALRVWAPSP